LDVLFVRATKYNMNYRQRGEARDGIIKQIGDNQDALQYMMTLQTKLRPTEKKSLQECQVASLSEQFRHFKNRLNCKLYGIRATRNPKIFSVLSMPVIEGFDKSAHGFHTLHYHVALGNIPEHIMQDELLLWMKDAWRRTRYGTSDVDIQVVRDDHKTYITKEILKNEGCGVDWLNVSIPIFALQLQ
jgi:hypothetical protein